jgi:hypothetical protein
MSVIPIHFSTLHQHIPLRLQPKRQNQQTHISRYTQRRKHTNHIPTRPKPRPRLSITINLLEELPIPLLPPIQASCQHSRSIRRKQRANTVKLGRKDLQHNQRKGKLA